MGTKQRAIEVATCGVLAGINIGYSYHAYQGGTVLYWMIFPTVLIVGVGLYRLLKA